MPHFDLTAVTDYVVLFLILLFFFSGWTKGLFQVLIMPILILFCSMLSIFYFYKTGNLKISILVMFLGPFVLNILISMILKIRQMYKKKKEEGTISIINRLLGGLFEVCWGSLFTIFMLVLLTSLPFNFFGLAAIQNDITHSKTYTLLNDLIRRQKMAELTRLSDMLQTLRDPVQMAWLQSTPEYIALIQDKHAQAIIQDDAIFQKAQDGKVLELLNDPNFMKMLYSQDLLKKFMNFEKRMVSKDYDNGTLFVPQRNSTGGR